MSKFQRAVPVLQVTNVERSIDWYANTFGFLPDPFPQQPPYSFAILRRDDSEIMLQCAPGAQRADPKQTIPTEYGWAVYLRTSGDGLLELATAIGQATPLVRGPERMFYGLVEFEVVDPDGYCLCVSGEVPASVKVSSRAERESAES